MILQISAKKKRTISFLLLALLYFETVIPSYALAVARSTTVYSLPAEKKDVNSRTLNSVPKAAIPLKEVHSLTNAKAFTGGPTQPEMQSFAAVNNANMVDLFTGDFSYSIPLLDVGGYPVTIGYNSGISMDQEASWVGLGWNINPGAIMRNMRGLPDDFSGTADSVQKVTKIKPNETYGGSIGADLELAGFSATPKSSDSTLSASVKLTASAGIFYNNYKGLGTEVNINSSLNAGSLSMGEFSGGLSLANNSQEGATVRHKISYSLFGKLSEKVGGFGGNIAVGATYSSRSGLKSLQLSAGLQQYGISNSNMRQLVNSGLDRLSPSATLSFAYPSYLPDISLPYTSTSLSVTLKTGSTEKVLHPNLFIQGYGSKQFIADEDIRMSLPAYGYLNYQQAGSNTAALLDFNRERDIPYREKPEVPNIGIPAYTYDVFSISGEGTGGMFRAYRGDIGYVFDHTMRTKDNSKNASIDFGAGDLFHGGLDVTYNRSTTTTGPWKELNPLAKNVNFSSSNKLHEAAYFRNPGEMAINDTTFYENIGGDDVVAVNLEQGGISGPDIRTTNVLNRYRNQRFAGKKVMSASNMKKDDRDKRTQVISYLTAEEAAHAGLSTYIENYVEDSFKINNCNVAFPNGAEGTGSGWIGEYYANSLDRFLFKREDTIIAFTDKELFNRNIPQGAPVGRFDYSFSIRWTGRIKAPVTGKYTFSTASDDGVRFYVNDTLLIDNWNGHPPTLDSAVVNLVADQFYNVVLEYRQDKERAVMALAWRYAGLPSTFIPRQYLYHMPEKDTFLATNASIVRETRINDFRKKNHLSEIDVLNADGRRYVYGIPVYNMQQREVTFAASQDGADKVAGLVHYARGTDNTTANQNGVDHYFSSEQLPAYAHSFLLTGILSPDYQDLTGDGISPDDPGDAIKFNYTKTAGIRNTYKWRMPMGVDSANYSEGLKTDYRDDKASYVHGEKELWYLHSVESKNMIATFKLAKRDDLPAVDENGLRLADIKTRRLEEINLYTKAEFARSNHPRPVKTVHFEYSYELCPGVSGDLNKGKLTLKKIWFTYNGNNKGQRNPYIFSYNKKNPSYKTNSSDRWGNYKDQLQNPGSVPGNVLTNADYPFALQDSTQAADNAAAWALDKIVLPSGGRMEISYESDDYAFVQNKRAAQLFKIAGFSPSAPSSLNDLKPELYGIIDYLYVAVDVPYKVNSNEEVYNRYLQNMDKLFFRLSVQMPGDKFGSGNEYVNCYATVDQGNYGFFNQGNKSTIWLRLKAIDPGAKLNTPKSVFSPLAQSAFQFLRLNLGSKAYPGSDLGDDNIDMVDAIKILLSHADNLNNLLLTFETAARMKHWARKVDLNRSFVRLNNPYYKKYGGGYRVKKVLIYDHWNKMTGQKESLYGQEYQYTTIKDIDGKKELISSGVAAYEPVIGGEENPWKVPVEYNLQVSNLVPVDRGYTELPYGEGFFPAPSVGYSKVRVRTIHADKRRSANGYEETCFYTGYDFPTLTDVTNLGDSKKRFKPLLSNLLRINARHYLGLSQGFKVELNDMTGKIKSQASYGEADPEKPITYTEYFYKVDNQQALNKHLSNDVKVISPQGNIASATIGKDIELMLDMRQQHSTSIGYSLNVNGMMFKFAWPPILFIPVIFNLVQREETKYSSVAATKIVYRHGILDSVLAIDKGSRVTTSNLLYDAETGSPLLTKTLNEFNDSLYSFTYPAAWAYDGMGGAYRNIGVELDHITMKDGRIAGLTEGPSLYFAAGDEILIYSHQKTGGTACSPEIATFPASAFIYTVDANALTGGTPDLYFVDKDGIPFTGNDISLKIVRSGRRNINGAVGSVVSLKNPIQGKALVLDSSRQIISSSAVAYKQFWKVNDKRKQDTSVVCVAQSYNDYVGAGGDCGIRYYGNVAKSKSIRKNDCGTGATGSVILYKVDANRYTSYISQAKADSMAQADIDSFGQSYANARGTCTFTYNSRIDSVTILAHTCQGDAIPLPYTYIVPAKTFTSNISQEDVDGKVKQRLIDSAQVVANRNGRCYYKNDTTGILAYPACGSTGIGSGIWVQIPAGVDTSMISKDAANAKARARYWAYAQSRANELSPCAPLPCNVFFSKKSDAGDLGVFNIYVTDVNTGQIVYMKQFNDPTDADLAKCVSLPSGSYSAQIDMNSGNLYVTVNGTERTVPAGSPQTWLFNVAGAGLTQTFLFSDKPVTVYSNTEYVGSYTKTDCPEASTGTAVPYTVPAGKYTSTISQQYVDSLAKAYADANGPDYANQHGSCNPTGTNVSIRQQDGSASPGGAYNIRILNASDNSTVVSFNYAELDAGLPIFRTIPLGTYIVEIQTQAPGLSATVNGVHKTLSGSTIQQWNTSAPIDIIVGAL